MRRLPVSPQRTNGGGGRGRLAKGGRLARGPRRLPGTHSQADLTIRLSVRLCPATPAPQSGASGGGGAPRLRTCHLRKRVITPPGDRLVVGKQGRLTFPPAGLTQENRGPGPGQRPPAAAAHRPPPAGSGGGPRGRGAGAGSPGPLGVRMRGFEMDPLGRPGRQTLAPRPGLGEKQKLQKVSRHPGHGPARRRHSPEVTAGVLASRPALPAGPRRPGRQPRGDTNPVLTPARFTLTYLALTPSWRLRRLSALEEQSLGGRLARELPLTWPHSLPLGLSLPTRSMG